jgi:hypothetical protein
MAGASDKKMNTYYTAKDIEELATKGVKQLEVGPNVFLTDFAYETAEQLDIKLVQPGEKVQEVKPASTTVSQNNSQGRYNKPRGCQHGSHDRSSSPVLPETNTQPAQSSPSEAATPVNRLVDIMGKIIKRGD